MQDARPLTAPVTQARQRRRSAPTGRATRLEVLASSAGRPGGLARNGSSRRSADVLFSCGRPCRLLVEDPELAEAIPVGRRNDAIKRCTAGVLTAVPQERRRPDFHAVDGPAIGLLVLDGLLARRVVIGDRTAAELLGEGDVLATPQGGTSLGTVPVDVSWTVLEPLRVAVLDGGFVRREVSRYPELTAPLMARAAQRSHNLAVNLAIVNQPRVEARLWMLLWHLAGRWGRVRSDAVVLPLRLTHSLLAELVAARRPSVSNALGGLARRKLVRRTRDGWVLARRPPGDEDVWEVLHTVNGAERSNPGHHRR